MTYESGIYPLEILLRVSFEKTCLARHLLERLRDHWPVARCSRMQSSG